MSAQHLDRVLIVGLGSPFGDDRAGWHVIERLASREPALRKIALRSPAELLDQLVDIEHLVVVDACRGAGEAGTVITFNWPAIEIGRVGFSGTHDMSLDAALGIAERLGLLPAVVSIWGVEIGESAHFESELTPAVARAVQEIVERRFEEWLSRLTA